MRPYRLVDEALDEDEDGHPRVVPIGTGARSPATPYGLTARARPWTPRGAVGPAAPSRPASPQISTPAAGFTWTHRVMIASFAIVCIGMILGMVMVRVLDEASRAVAALPPEGSAASSKPAAAPAEPAAQTTPVAGSTSEVAGAVTTEIRVLQPNYTVAPGDTLGIIARRHGTTVEALASINNLENRNSLGVGQKLIIP